MKMLNIVNAVYGKNDLLQIDSTWMVRNNKIQAVVPEIKMDDDVEVVYYWYHHLMPKEDAKQIQIAIDNHDFETFDKYYEKYEVSNMVFFPSEAVIYKDDDMVGTVRVLYDSNMFNLICASESECG